ncbi:hypothetical protein [Halolamina salina]|uniref:Uncharacterized protein n=1 Tax=Halolamina salina TaxID=1220023 RepID=A0ABD6B4T0_9EURY
MPEPQTGTTAEQPDALFDRYTLPKVALGVILAASLAGTWVTATLDGTATLAGAVAKWLYLVGLGVLTGGLVWKHVFVRPADLGDDAADYCAEMYDRFDRIAAGATVVLAVSGAVVLREYVAVFGPTTALVGYAALVGALLAMALVQILGSEAVERQFRTPTGVVTLGLALAVVVATAVAEVAVTGLDPAAVVVRVLHLVAFAVWVGGAVWNIFVAVPTGQKRPTVPVVRAAGEQLERFRWAVRFVIPTLFLTGLYQAVDGLGVNAEAYLGSAVGLTVLAKVGFIGVLVVVFKLCPMWRACSPIEGVCELDELGGEGTADSDPTAGGSEVRSDD